MSTDDNDGRPIGFLGKVRSMKVLTWVLIFAIVAVTAGATTFLILIQQ